MKRILDPSGWCMLFLILLASCYSAKKAERQIRKALVNYPAVVAKVARDAFPCITLKTDTTITTIDTTIIINCPSGNDFEGGDIGLEGGIIKYDTLHNKFPMEVTHYVKVPVILPIKTVTVLKTIEDSAKIAVLQSMIRLQDETIVNQQKENTEFSETIKRKNKWILYLWLTVAVSIVGFILKLIIKFK